MITRALLVIALIMAAPAFAATPPESLSDPTLEARASTLQKELRCVVCQGESLDDSNATIAADLRKLIREKITEGLSDSEVKTYLVARYGDFILMKPPLQPATYLLWFGPILALLGGLIVIVLILNKSRK